MIHSYDRWQHSCSKGKSIWADTEKCTLLSRTWHAINIPILRTQLCAFWQMYSPVTMTLIKIKNHFHYSTNVPHATFPSVPSHPHRGDHYSDSNTIDSFCLFFKKKKGGGLISHVVESNSFLFVAIVHWMFVPPHSYVAALTPIICVFTNAIFKEIITVKW